jgi:hypothetical protein
VSNPKVEQMNRDNHNKTYVTWFRAVDAWNGNEVRDEHQDNKRKKNLVIKQNRPLMNSELVNKRL